MERLNISCGSKSSDKPPESETPTVSREAFRDVFGPIAKHVGDLVVGRPLSPEAQRQIQEAIKELLVEARK